MSIKNTLRLWGLLGLLAISCVKEQQEVVPAFTDDPVFHATIDGTGGSAVRAYANEQLCGRWDAGDHISIFNKNTINRDYAFQGQTGDNSGEFRKSTGESFFAGNPLDFVYAIYPYSESTSISDDGVVSLTLPAEQPYRENTFGRDANTMIAISCDDELLFKNLCGYFAIQLYGENITVSSITLKGNRNELLGGRASVIARMGEPPVLNLDTSSATGEITLNCPNPVSLGSTAESATAFWFALPPTTFSSGISVTINYNEDKCFEKSTTGSLIIQRSCLIRSVPLLVNRTTIPEGHYVDELGIDHGLGTTIDGITWAPVNCGYKKATDEHKGYPYGKLYQWGRKDGQGYGAPYLSPPGSYSDESTPVIASYWKGKNEDADAGTFYYGITEPYNWISTSRNYWNIGTEDEPVKSDLYDPCPEGWRVPTLSELSTLADGYYSDVIMVDGVYGVWYSGSTYCMDYEDPAVSKIFLPACGGRFADNWAHKCGASGRGGGGSYWSSSLSGDYAYNMPIRNTIGTTYKGFGFAVRCCRDEVNGGGSGSTTVSLDRSSLTLTEGASESLVASIAPESVDDKRISWESSDESVAVVDENGTVTGIKAGTANIVARAVIGGGADTCMVSVVPDETQYPWDGEVVTLQSGSPGLNLVILGDGFVKADFDDGTYDGIMRNIYADFFSIEPFTTIQSGFSVYYVKVPSPQRFNAKTTGANGAQNSDAKTKFSVQFTPNSTAVRGDDDLVKEYAKKALGQNADERIKTATIIVVANQKCRAGTNYISFTYSGDYGLACSIAYFGLGRNDAEREELVHHEACGHGFGLFGDEYASNWITSMSTLDWWQLDNRHRCGIHRNIDKYVSESTYEQIPNGSYEITTNSTVYWADLFNTDNGYESEDVESLGFYEGAFTYFNFFCRPTKDGSKSIMNENTGIFNAPSRRQIYYRYLRLTGQVSDDQFGSEVELNRFLAWDAALLPRIKERAPAMRRQSRSLLEGTLPLTGPVIMAGEWADGKFVPYSDDDESQQFSILQLNRPL